MGWWKQVLSLVGVGTGRPGGTDLHRLDPAVRRDDQTGRDLRGAALKGKALEG